MKSIYCTENYLGVNKDADNESPNLLAQEFINNVDKYEILKSKDIVKDQNQEHKKKNINEINEFNKCLYEEIKDDNNFVISVGGDHSIAIASGLASISKCSNQGLIWFDSHSDYHTFDTTMTGNIHGLPFATLTGNNKELSFFHKGNFYNPKNCILVGARSIDVGEDANLEKDGVTVFTTSDIKERGAKEIVELAFKMALKNTDKLHISYDLDLLDPMICPGVTIKEDNGITKEDNDIFIDYIVDNINNVNSFDLVEYNKLNDIDNKTYEIGKEILKKIVNN